MEWNTHPVVLEAGWKISCQRIGGARMLGKCTHLQYRWRRRYCLANPIPPSPSRTRTVFNHLTTLCALVSGQSQRKRRPSRNRRRHYTLRFSRTIGAKTTLSILRNWLDLNVLVQCSPQISINQPRLFFLTNVDRSPQSISLKEVEMSGVVIVCNRYCWSAGEIRVKEKNGLAKIKQYASNSGEKGGQWIVN